MREDIRQLAVRTPFVANGSRLIARLHRWLTAMRPVSASARLQALRCDIGRLLRIDPVFVSADRAGFLNAARAARLDAMVALHEHRLVEEPTGKLFLRRFCLCCNESTRMLMDHEASFTTPDGRRAFNWRERLVCSQCGMNNRQRLVAKLVQQAAGSYSQPRIYLMEQITPIFAWTRRLAGAQVEGSEYLGHQYRGGQLVKGVRHEDVLDLSYPDRSFDLIVSNDVLEHIPDPARALRECFRVLKPGGCVLATFPFHVNKATTTMRARLADDRLEHLLPPVYHGNPVSSDGSLVFNDFGWDVLDTMRDAGFDQPVCEVYASDRFGHLGSGLLVFRMARPSEP